MSAIVGIHNIRKEKVSFEDTDTLMSELKKFPANDVKTLHLDNIFLGCLAQWITPESVGEPLPFYDRNRELAITADAIIDNRLELFERLQVEKHLRKSMPDSQLILLAYSKWGIESPKYLVGDFAFMIWDQRKNRIFGARDFSGTRTLYYYFDHLRFAFCTTIKPLLLLPYIKTRLNQQWLAEFLAVSGMVDTVDASVTPYLSVEQVPPSHSLLIEGNKIKLIRYCSLTSVEKIKYKKNEDYVEAFQEIFQEAVNCRVRTYHEVGAQLSGGLDSGSIVSFAARKLREEKKLLHTFSYIPPADFVDFTPRNIMPNETPFIKETVRYVGNISDNYHDFAGRDPYTEIDSFLDLMEMPYKFFENSFWLKGMFEKAKEKGVGVLLNGGRGNLSISWGSAIEYYGFLLKRLRFVRLSQELNQYSQVVGGSRYRRLPLIAKVAFPRINKFLKAGQSPYEMPALINSEFARKTDVYNKLSEFGMDETGWFSSNDVFEHRKSHFSEVFHWNASNTLASKLSLPFSLLKRDPTNDIRVIRFCLSIPEEQYVQNGMDRALIRRSTENLLPDEVRLNQRIRGVQGADWVHRMLPHWDKLSNELRSLNINSRIFEFVSVEMFEDAVSKTQKKVTPECAIDPYYKALMRVMIVNRFIQKFA